MTTGISGQGISFIIKSPAALGDLLDTERLAADSVTSYTHKVVAIGGYESAEIGILVPNLATAELWLETALGWHIEVYGRSGARIWEGFINQIAVNGSLLSTTHGPLMNVANRASVMYTPIIGWDANGKPITGTETETTISEDTTSQNVYGILEEVVSGGQLLDDGTTNDAEFVRDVYLRENAYPKTTSAIAFGGGAGEGVSVTLSCRGYFDWLEKYAYNGGVGQSVTAYTKIVSVLGADPNGIFSTNYALVDTNAVLVNDLEEKNRTAMAVIREILSLGDGTDLPYLFGIYNNRTVKYSSIPTSVAYYYKILSQQASFAEQDGTEIDPYDILPGKWALAADFQVDSARQGFSVFKDPRAIFIENVDFTAPNSVSVSGSPVVSLPQLLAKIGLYGFI